MQGHNILEGVVILRETIHEVHQKKQNGVILKIDFEKAYDKVKWSFLFQTLKMKGFSSKWISWIKSFVKGGVLPQMLMMMSGTFSKYEKAFGREIPYPYYSLTL
jgi:hypothetical protein